MLVEMLISFSLCVAHTCQSVRMWIAQINSTVFRVVW